MQLLNITTTPMKYELEVEHARLEVNPAEKPVAKLESKTAELNLQAKNTSVNIDTYEARRSIGIENVGDMLKTSATNGVQHINELTKEYVQIGKEMGQIQNGTNISSIYQNKMLEQPSLVTTFLPEGGADLTWNPAELNVNYEEAELLSEWQIDKNKMNFVPGSVRLKILEAASVNIEYIGGPMYVPPSASPDFEE